MKETNNKLKWFDSNPFFSNKDGYDEFISAMTAAAQENNLPICLQHNDPERLAMKDIKQFSQVFMQDTGLNIEFQLSTCNDCGKLHCFMIVDQQAAS